MSGLTSTSSAEDGEGAVPKVGRMSSWRQWRTTEYAAQSDGLSTKTERYLGYSADVPPRTHLMTHSPTLRTIPLRITNIPTTFCPLAYPDFPTMLRPFTRYISICASPYPIRYQPLERGPEGIVSCSADSVESVLPGCDDFGCAVRSN
jgi:hypothetical protein